MSKKEAVEIVELRISPAKKREMQQLADRIGVSIRDMLLVLFYRYSCQHPSSAPTRGRGKRV